VRDSAFLLHQLGQSEIRQMRLAVGIEQNIGWLDVAMQQPMLVRVM
jgi:hypothetical protein